MDKIIIKNLIIYGNHGVFQAEKTLGQRFEVDIELLLDLQKPGMTGNLKETVHYGELSHEIIEIFKDKSVDLIETVAEELAQYILKEYPIVKEVKLRVKKPWAPIMTPVDTVLVSIHRKRYRAFLSLGSNMGDSPQILKEAIEELNTDHTQVISKSSTIITEPWGEEDQDDFYNLALEIQTTLTPHNLLGFTQSIENKLGRIRNKKWGPRLIDIDILFIDNMKIYTDDLIVPHPYIEERDFVLEPMAEIAPFFVHPVYNKQIRILLKELMK